MGEVGIEPADVDLLAGVSRLDVGGHGEVVVPGGDIVLIHHGDDVRDILLPPEELHDTLDLLVGEDVLIGLLGKEVLTAGVDELDPRVGLVLGEDEDIGGDGGAVEEVGRQGDDGLDVILPDEVLPDLLLRPAAVEDAREADDGGAPGGGEVIESGG